MNKQWHISLMKFIFSNVKNIAICNNKGESQDVTLSCTFHIRGCGCTCILLQVKINWS